MYDVDSTAAGIGLVGELWMMPGWDMLWMLPYAYLRNFLGQMVARAAESGLQVKAAFENEFSLLNLMVFIRSSHSLLPSSLIQVSSLNRSGKKRILDYFQGTLVSPCLPSPMTKCCWMPLSYRWPKLCWHFGKWSGMQWKIWVWKRRCNYCFSTTDLVMQTELVLVNSNFEDIVRLCSDYCACGTLCQQPSV